ncbi:tumor necrosis factor receptor superfamily member 4 [Poecilia reticulata]|uniref:tumor necrosis factor receptor superfamily member 4 n=1 Tax=Poecilia reticulata TaxID=8081 RepID=UPI0004A28DB4|nr:PREDICTED: tumor necrosis factor receptor superfamily member 4 [Poecilia reticulata]
MFLFNLLIFILTLNVFIVDSDARMCDRGQKVKKLPSGKTECEPCGEGTFQATPKKSQSCDGCTTCYEESGSDIKEKCTAVKNTVCGCRDGFVPRARDSSICKCDIGSGLENGVCSKCKEGYFSQEINTQCQKWKDCKSAGIKQAGSSTSDVVCNEMINDSQTTVAPTTISKVFSSLSTTRRPHEGAPIQKTRSSTTTTTVQRPTVRNTTQNTSIHIGTAILILGIFGLLGLTAMTCKLHVTHCWQTKPAVQTKDSLCRRPVEESGDGSESSLKLNPEP